MTNHGITGRDILHARKRAGIVQPDLAQALGITVAKLIDIERERVLSLTPSHSDIMRTISRWGNKVSHE